MTQMTLDGTILIYPYCAFCGAAVKEVSTQEYFKYLKRTHTKVARCPDCEVDFLQIVFNLSEKQANILRKKWAR